MNKNQITFEIGILHDTETDREFYQVQYGDCEEFFETHMSNVMKEIALVCKHDNNEAIIKITPNCVVFVERSKLNAD